MTRDFDKPVKILLASGSPRRRALLRDMGWSFGVCSPDVDESHLPGEGPGALCERLSRLKAEAGAASAGEENTMVIAADTIVVIYGKILGKPADRDDACAMLRLLQGRTHEVMTGVALRYNGRTHSGVERTAVRFRPLSEDEISAYVQTGECDDKAGAYAIQGRGSLLIESIDGDYFNVVGLPLCRLSHMMEEMGLPLAGQLRWEEKF